MYYFENDPLQSVYEDLSRNKPRTHFDQVLELKGSLCLAFEDSVETTPIPTQWPQPWPSDHKPKGFTA